jgi:hypothetical protein
MSDRAGWCTEERSRRVVVAVGLVVFGACATAPWAKPPGTTAPNAPEAQAAILTAGDLGGTWADDEVQPRVDTEELHRCWNQTGLLDGLADAQIAEGTTIVRGVDNVSARGRAWVFPTADRAQAFGAHLVSEAQVACQRDLRAQVDPDGGLFRIVPAGTETGDGSTPFVGAYRFDFQVVKEGVATPTGSGSRNDVYVKGTTVIDLDTSVAPSPASSPDLGERARAEIDDAMDWVLARVAS